MNFLKVVSLFVLIIFLSQCKEDPTPSFIKVNLLSVSDIPSKNNNGDDWDGLLQGEPEWNAILFLDDGNLDCDPLEDNKDAHLVTEATSDEYGVADFTLTINHNVTIEDLERGRLGIKLIEPDLGDQFDWLSCQLFASNFYENRDDTFTLDYTESNGVVVSITFEKIF